MASRRREVLRESEIREFVTSDILSDLSDLSDSGEDSDEANNIEGTKEEVSFTFSDIIQQSDCLGTGYGYVDYNNPIPGPSGDHTVSTPYVSETRPNDDDDEIEEEVARPRPSQVGLPTKRRKKDIVCYDWSNDDRFRPTLFQFDDSHCGLNPMCNITDESTCLDYFLLLFSLDLVSHIVEQTNLFFTDIVSQLPNISPHEINTWKPVSADELLSFLALCVLMSHVRKNRLNDYWSTDDMVETAIFGKVMSRNRFKMILRMLHFNNNKVTNTKVLGRLHKIDPILCTLNKSYSNSFTPFQHLAIDETLFLFKGRLIFRQYIPSKRARFGIKLFVLADSKTGFVYNILPYIGSSTRIGFEELKDKIGMSGQVVLTMLEPFFDLGYKVYLDNWYVSPALAQELLKRGTHMCGTVRANRTGLPKRDTKLEKGETDTFHTNDMLYQIWQDKREVRMVSTMHKPGLADTGKKDRKSGQAEMKPVSVLDYNVHMGGVDIGDMQLSFNSSARKSIKWYKKLFFHLLDVTIRNSYVLMKQKTRKSMQLSEFRLELAREMIQKYNTVKTNMKGGRPAAFPNPMRLTQRHFLEPIPPTPKNPRPRRHCHVCANSTKREKKRQDTYYMCIPCKTPLCIHPCMMEYHSLVKY